MPIRWKLLTGPRDQIQELLIEGFRVPMGEPVEVRPDLIDIAHSGKLVLVDGNGEIRGYYEYDRAGVAKLYEDSLALRRE